MINNTSKIDIKNGLYIKSQLLDPIENGFYIETLGWDLICNLIFLNCDHY